MSYLTDSYIVFTLKMKSASKITIFGLKVMVKSGLQTILLEQKFCPDYNLRAKKMYESVK